jgi:glutamine synthetase
MDAHTVLQRAAEAHLRLVRFLYCDNGGIIRGKATHVNGLARRLSEGIGQTLAMQAFAGVDALAACWPICQPSWPSPLDELHLAYCLL